MAKQYNNNVVKFPNGFSITTGVPIDNRTVVTSIDDLTNGTFGADAYKGMIVNIAGTCDLYVFIGQGSRDVKKPEKWKKVGGDSSACVHAILSSVDNLTDGSIESLEKGSIAFVNNSEDTKSNGLYILVDEDGTKLTNWVKISGEFSEKNIGINQAPESGNGIRVDSTDKEILEYISSDSPIKAGEFYSSIGLNTYDEKDGKVAPKYITLKNDKGTKIVLFDGKGDDEGNDQCWIAIALAEGDDSLTPIHIKSKYGTVQEYVQEDPIKPIPNGVQVSFGKDVDFTGWTETRGGEDTKYTFGVDGSTYEDVDIYSKKPVVNVYAYSNGERIRVLTEADKIDLEDRISNVEEKLDNLAETIMVDPDGDGSEESTSLQNVIINMNNAINKLEEINIEFAEESDIDNMDESDLRQEAVVNIKTLKYFRDKLMQKIPYSVEDGKAMVEINNSKTELVTKQYVDNRLSWLDTLD